MTKGTYAAVNLTIRYPCHTMFCISIKKKQVNRYRVIYCRESANIAFIIKKSSCAPENDLEYFS